MIKKRVKPCNAMLARGKFRLRNSQHRIEKTVETVNSCSNVNATNVTRQILPSDHKDNCQVEKSEITIYSSDTFHTKWCLYSVASSCVFSDMKSFHSMFNMR
ncbi:hypothetical protein T03_3024 [Trichinella britovi]|uniref:Uncharacterized protein n=1 Tax=Trichinella britovi TaxID=45882 RepID=A0A0V1D8X0_TRIBR|nr:hypothetical protein T03_3024 [Trichinella britovi]